MVGTYWNLDITLVAGASYELSHAIICNLRYVEPRDDFSILADKRHLLAPATDLAALNINISDRLEAVRRVI